MQTDIISVLPRRLAPKATKLGAARVLGKPILLLLNRIPDASLASLSVFDSDGKIKDTRPGIINHTVPADPSEPDVAKLLEKLPFRYRTVKRQTAQHEKIRREGWITKYGV